MRKFLSTRFYGLIFLSILMAGCSPNQSNSLLNDQKQDPTNHVVDKTPKVDELYLKVDNSSVAVAAGETKADVSGDCYFSTYPAHQIVAMDNGTVIDIMDVNPTSDASIARSACVNGRFNLVLNAAALASGSHSIRFVMQAYDSKKQMVTNDVQGVSTLTLTK
ncbi:MAG: hypothetical protein ACXVCY_08170 [Pseudobdellovibrionaceae bacterium]